MIVLDDGSFSNVQMSDVFRRFNDILFWILAVDSCNSLVCVVIDCKRELREMKH